jgi:hypothetical protein
MFWLSGDCWTSKVRVLGAFLIHFEERVSTAATSDRPRFFGCAACAREAPSGGGLSYIKSPPPIGRLSVIDNFGAMIASGFRALRERAAWGRLGIVQLGLNLRELRPDPSQYKTVVPGVPLVLAVQLRFLDEV